MAKLNRTCFTCGEKHSYCPDCYDDRHLESWHIMFHDENCKNVFNIINQYFYSHITTEEAIKQLKCCDLTIKFIDDIQNEVDKLLIKDKPAEEPVVNMEYKNSYKNKK